MASTKAEKQRQLEELIKSTHFDDEEISHIQQIFGVQTEASNGRTSIITHGRQLDRNNFREILHKSFTMTDDIIMDRVFRTFSATGDNTLTLEDFVTGMSVFLRGTLEEHIKFCFAVYDLNNDDYLTREEMSHLLKQTMVKSQSEEDREEATKDLVDLVMKKMDHDKDGRVSKSDYEQTVTADPLLLEAFGTCLPQPRMVNQFLSASAFDLYY